MALETEAEEVYTLIELAAAKLEEKELRSSILPQELRMVKRVVLTIKRFLRHLEDEDDPSNRAEDLSGELDDGFTNIQKLYKRMSRNPTWTRTMGGLAEEMLNSFTF